MIAAILRWPEYTERRAVFVVSIKLAKLWKRGLTEAGKSRFELDHIIPLALGGSPCAATMRMAVLPNGFHRIRHYGLFASARNIARARELLAASSQRNPIGAAPSCDWPFASADDVCSMTLREQLAFTDEAPYPLATSATYASRARSIR